MEYGGIGYERIQLQFRKRSFVLMAVVELQPSVTRQSAWYAIYSKHQHEKKAANLLARKGFEILLPTYRSVRRWKDRNKTILLPLFPCYLFVRTDLYHKVDILRTAGVHQLVESGGCACPIPEHDIEAIKRITNSSATIAPHPFLRNGERVRVRHGSFEGIEGILIRFKSQHRVVIAVEPLQKAFSVEVDLAAIEPLRAKRHGSFRPIVDLTTAARPDA